MTLQHTVSPEEFMATLRRRADGADGRAMLASLRRGLGRSVGESAESHRYVAWAIQEDTGRWRERCLYLVAALFGLHSAPSADDRVGENLGATLARLASLSGLSSESIERRFTALLAADGDQLGDHLRHAVSLLKSHDVPVPWARLLRDLEAWSRDDRSVQRRWAQAFWRRIPESGQSPPPAGDTPDAAPTN